jgi:hypothetical protein
MTSWLKWIALPVVLVAAFALVSADNEADAGHFHFGYSFGHGCYVPPPPCYAPVYRPVYVPYCPTYWYPRWCW